MKKPDKEQPKGELIGYARVSTVEQNLALQKRALERAGCLNIYEEKVSGASKRRPQLDLAIKDLREGDTLVVWRLDRFARSLQQLHKRLDDVVAQGAKFKSLTEEFDIASATGRLMLNLLGVIAEFERQLTVDRTKAGIEAAKERGVKFGRAPVLDKRKKAQILSFLKQPGKKLNNKQIAKRIGVSPSTIQNFLKDERKKKPRAKYLYRKKQV